MQGRNNRGNGGRCKVFNKGRNNASCPQGQGRGRGMGLRDGSCQTNLDRQISQDNNSPQDTMGK